MSLTKGLTKKRALWLKHYMDRSNPETFCNATASARAAGYNCKRDATYEQIGSENLRLLKDRIARWLEEEGFSEEKLKLKIIQGLECFETKFFAHEGMVTDSREVIPWETRRKYLEMACKVLGLFAPDKVHVTGLEGLAERMTAANRRVDSDGGESGD